MTLRTMTLNQEVCVLIKDFVYVQFCFYIFYKPESEVPSLHSPTYRVSSVNGNDCVCHNS